MTGDQLKKYRQREGLSQEALAEKLFISQPQVSRYESGECPIPAQVPALLGLDKAGRKLPKSKRKAA